MNRPFFASQIAVANNCAVPIDTPLARAVREYRDASRGILAAYDAGETSADIADARAYRAERALVATLMEQGVSHDDAQSMAWGLA